MIELTRMGGERHWRSIQFKHPVFLNEYFHSCLFFLDGTPTIKLLTAFFLEPGGSGWRYTPICGSQSIGRMWTIRAMASWSMPTCIVWRRSTSWRIRYRGG